MNQPEETKLLSPCPWCNKTPEQSQDVDEVYCFNPHCALYRFTMSAEDWNTRATPSQPSLCIHTFGSSRMCELGTAGCNVNHGKQPSPTWEYVGNLLAIIHKDGGHYTAEHGVKKSTDDAIEIVCEMKNRLAGSTTWVKDAAEEIEKLYHVLPKHIHTETIEQILTRHAKK